MALLDWLSPEPSLVLEGAGVRLRPPRLSDYAEWAELRSASRAFLQPWEPVWPDDDLTRTGYRRRLSAYAYDQERGQGFSFFVFRAEDDLLTGGITLSNVRRGVAQCGSVGYWCGQRHTRRGYTLAALDTLKRFAFDRLGLHRLEAACLPSNGGSRDLLLKGGFEEEGRARAYLRINGVWHDHLLFGLIAPQG